MIDVGKQTFTARLPATVVALAWTACLAPLVAAEFQELDTDRDAFTPATTTAKAGTVLTESSYVWIDNRGLPATNSFPELLVRIGARERLEWRFGFNYEQNSGGSVVAAVEVGEPPREGTGSEEANLLYGIKVRVTDQSDWLPRSAVIVEAFTPVAGDIWGTEPSATYAFGWELPTAWRLDTAIRYCRAESEEGWFDRWMPSTVLRIPVTERFEVHAEWFGSWTQGLADDSVQPFAGPGTHFMLTPTFEIGCRMGWGLTRDAAGYFVDAGVGWRF
jgi:hypothetical protein